MDTITRIWFGRAGTNAVFSAEWMKSIQKTVLLLALLIAVCVPRHIPKALGETAGPETAANAKQRAGQLRKALPPESSKTLSLMLEPGDEAEAAAAYEIVELISGGLETGPHGDAVLNLAPKLDKGGIQNIADLLTLADCDMAILPLPLLIRASGEIGEENLRKHIVYIAPLFKEEFHLLASWSISEVKQLAGKTVNLGVKDSAGDILGREIFNHLGLNVNVVNIEHTGAIRAIQEGKIDADLVLSGKPLSALQDYTLAGPFRFLGIPPVEGLEKDFVPAKLTHGDYPKLIPEGVVYDTIAVPSVLIAYNWPKGSSRYRLLDLFARTFLLRFSELESGSHLPKWREIDLNAAIPGLTQFPPAERWLDQREFEFFLAKRRINLPADRTQLFQDLIRLRK